MTDRVMDQRLSEKKGVTNEKGVLSVASGSVNQEMIVNSRGIDGMVALEMSAVSKSAEECVNKGMVTNVLEDKEKVKGLEDQKHSSCVIDVKAGESSNAEWVCRICHLTTDQSLGTTGTSTGDERELIQLGCGCKDELGTAHSYCAEAWFKLKGNRLCEICGETAKNITGIADNRFMEEWNIRVLHGQGVQSSERSRGFWRGQPFCNFLMACLIVAFLLPWFFRASMF